MFAPPPVNIMRDMQMARTSGGSERRLLWMRLCRGCSWSSGLGELVRRADSTGWARWENGIWMLCRGEEGEGSDIGGSEGGSEGGSSAMVIRDGS